MIEGAGTDLFTTSCEAQGRSVVEGFGTALFTTSC